MAMMPSKGTNGIYRPLAEINVTPLVDVMLVLLIIFMVTAPMLASGMKVNLPQAKRVQPLDPKAPIVITVSKDGTISLGSDAIERDRLIDTVQAKLGGDINQVIHLRGDKEAFYGDVVAIMDQLAANGLTHIAIVADPHDKQEPPAKTGMQTNTAVPETQTNPAVMAPVERSPVSSNDAAPAANAPMNATPPALSATVSPIGIDSGNASRP